MDDRDEAPARQKYPQHVLRALYWKWLLTEDKDLLALYVESGGKQDERTERFIAKFLRGDVKGTKSNPMRDIEVHARVEEKIAELVAEGEARNVEAACNGIEADDAHHGRKKVRSKTLIDQHKRGEKLRRWFFEMPENADIESEFEVIRTFFAASNPE